MSEMVSDDDEEQPSNNTAVEAGDDLYEIPDDWDYIGDIRNIPLRTERRWYRTGEKVVEVSPDPHPHPDEPQYRVKAVGSELDVVIPHEPDREAVEKELEKVQNIDEDRYYDGYERLLGALLDNWDTFVDDVTGLQKKGASHVFFETVKATERVNNGNPRAFTPRFEEWTGYVVNYPFTVEDDEERAFDALKDFLLNEEVVVDGTAEIEVTA